MTWYHMTIHSHKKGCSFFQFFIQKPIFVISNPKFQYETSPATIPVSNTTTSTPVSDTVVETNPATAVLQSQNATPTFTNLLKATYIDLSCWLWVDFCYFTSVNYALLFLSWDWKHFFFSIISKSTLNVVKSSLIVRIALQITNVYCCPISAMQNFQWSSANKSDGR